MARCEPYKGRLYCFRQIDHLKEHDFVAIELLLERPHHTIPSTSRNNTPIPTVVSIAAYIKPFTDLHHMTQVAMHWGRWG